MLLLQSTLPNEIGVFATCWEANCYIIHFCLGFLLFVLGVSGFPEGVDGSTRTGSRRQFTADSSFLPSPYLLLV